MKTKIIFIKELQKKWQEFIEYRMTKQTANWIGFCRLHKMPSIFDPKYYNISLWKNCYDKEQYEKDLEIYESLKKLYYDLNPIEDKTFEGFMSWLAKNEI